jgi:hypothetical protein
MKNYFEELVRANFRFGRMRGKIVYIITKLFPLYIGVHVPV